MAVAFDDPRFFCAVRNAVQFALDSKFSDIATLKPVEEKALLAFIKSTDALWQIKDRFGGISDHETARK